ncbi:hypothetical protein L3X38_042181 [Prunus dulcis]|uniref:Uncharacterized protein n=1 Tax=Prunus dulcis TaxID=3755 RepID=A0AAD4UWC5_PRUDU|nr:hypothetical protein L3X38_042181 [Prunus dulcis]
MLQSTPQEPDVLFGTPAPQDRVAPIPFYHITSSPLVDMGCYNPPPWGPDFLVGTLAPYNRVALIPFYHIPDKLRHRTILCTRTFRATSQRVTHPGITLAQTRLTSEFP